MVREGYKETEFGEIPDEWELVKIEEALSKIIDYRGKSPEKTESGTPLITAKNVREGYLSFDEREFIHADYYNNWMTRGIPNSGDVLFTTEAPLGNVALLPPGKFALAQRIIVLCPNYSRVNNVFLKFLILSENFKRLLSQKGTGSTVSGIKQSTFRILQITLPPLPEQHRIATVLSTLDECIEKTEALIAKLKQVKAGLMQDLLTRGIDSEGRIRDESTHEFKDTEIGRVPVEWELRRFSTLAAFKNGVNFEKQNLGKGIKIIGVTDFQNYSVPDYNSVQEIDPRGIVKDIDLLQENDFLFVRSNGNIELVGRTLLIKNLKEKTIHSGFTIRARFFSFLEINPMFFSYYFKSAYFRKKVNTLGGGTNISNISQEMLSEFLVLVPSFDEQNRIDSILSAADYRISHEKQYLKKFYLQKRGLMADLLTGRVRIN